MQSPQMRGVQPVTVLHAGTEEKGSDDSRGEKANKETNRRERAACKEKAATGEEGTAGW